VNTNLAVKLGCPLSLELLIEYIFKVNDSMQQRGKSQGCVLLVKLNKRNIYFRGRLEKVCFSLQCHPSTKREGYLLLVTTCCFLLFTFSSYRSLTYRLHRAS